MKTIVSLILSAGMLLSTAYASDSNYTYRDEFRSSDEPTYNWNDPTSICAYNTDNNELLMCDIDSMEVVGNEIVLESHNKKVRINSKSNYYIANNQIELHAFGTTWKYRTNNNKSWKNIPVCEAH